MKIITFNSRDQLLRVRIDSIVYIEADGNYCDIILKNKMKGTVNMSLAKMEETLRDHAREHKLVFVRLGRRFIINPAYVFLVAPLRQQLVLSDQEHFAFQLKVPTETLRTLKSIIPEKKL